MNYQIGSTKFFKLSESKHIPVCRSVFVKGNCSVQSLFLTGFLKDLLELDHPVTHCLAAEKITSCPKEKLSLSSLGDWNLLSKFHGCVYKIWKINLRHRSFPQTYHTHLEYANHQHSRFLFSVYPPFLKELIKTKLNNSTSKVQSESKRLRVDFVFPRHNN